MLTIFSSAKWEGLSHQTKYHAETTENKNAIHYIIIIIRFTFPFHSILSSWHSHYVLQVLSLNPAFGQNHLLHAISVGVCGLWCPNNKKFVCIHTYTLPTVQHDQHCELRPNTYFNFSLSHEPRNIAATRCMFLIHLLLVEYISLINVGSVFFNPLHLIKKTIHLFTICNIRPTINV